jgi:hypothetical protein
MNELNPLRILAKLKLTLRVFDGNGGGEGGGPYKPPVGKSTIKGSPGLLTSTGGLTGTSFQLLMPLFDATFEKTYFALIEPNNNDTEEVCFYTFRSEDVMVNRQVSVHKLLITYREIGKAKFTIGIQTYIEDNDTFKTVSKDITIKLSPPRKAVTFPDGKLHTKKVSLIISGERPQIFISRNPNSGPLCITRVLMCGKADQKDQV